MHRSKIIIVSLFLINFADCYATSIFSWLRRQSCCKSTKIYHENFEYCDQIVADAIVTNFKQSIHKNDIFNLERTLSIFDITTEVKYNGMILTRESLCNGDHTRGFNPVEFCAKSENNFVDMKKILLEAGANPAKY